MLDVEKLSVRRGTFLLRDVTLRVEPGRTLALLGPNGAGKSTLLEAIAGLTPIASGRVAIDGVDVTHLPPERRRVGYLVQDYALFPHLTVRQNVRFGATRERRASGFVDELLTRLRLDGLAARRPGALSGGERQRVALARALAADARILLFDEPFAAIDPAARPELHVELRALLAELGVPALFVTHDHVEARALADDVAILHDGALVQGGPIEHVFATPADPFVARFVGIENGWSGRVAACDGDAVLVALDDAPVTLVVCDGARFAPGTRVLACVRAEDVEIDLGGSGTAPNRLAVSGVAVRTSGAFVRLELTAPIPLLATVSKRDAAAVLAQPRTFAAEIAPAAIHLVPVPAPAQIR